jgi:prophage antirepressor-like protein
MNNSNLSVFSFESRNVRYLIVDFEPWFCLSDVLIAINSATKPSEAEALIKSELGLNFCFSVTKDETKKQLKLKNEFVSVDGHWFDRFSKNRI